MIRVCFYWLAAVGTYGVQGQRGSCLFTLDWVACLVPCHVTTAKCKCMVSLFLEERRHTGARKFIRSGTVGDDGFVTRQLTKPVLNFLRRDADRILNGPGHGGPDMRSNHI